MFWRKIREKKLKCQTDFLGFLNHAGILWMIILCQVVDQRLFFCRSELGAVIDHAVHG
jgi:hypothetical protein